MLVYYLGSSIIERCDCGENNLGKGGLKSSYLMSYYRGVNLKGSIVVLYIGSNDIRSNDQDEKTIYKNIVNFIESIVSEVKKIIYVGILKEPLTKNKKAIDYVNKRMREYAKKHNKVYTVNVNREIKSEDYLEDKVHLNEEGNKKLKSKIKEVM
jgi:lysophospholipase L1-like esterase